MPSFQDNAGRSWAVDINVTTLKRVRQTLGFDLLEVGDRQQGQSAIVRLLGDPILQVDVLYLVCKEQADQRGISDEDFGRAMAGDPIDAATEALLEGLVSFIPNPRDRARLQTALGKMRQWMEQGRDVLQQKLEDPRLEQTVQRALRRLGDSFTNWPESSASGPGPTP